MNLYVGNISYHSTEETLAALFRAHGEVASAHIIYDRDTGRSRGFGFVEMPDNQQAKAAMSALADTDVDGRNLIVNEARPRTNRY